MSIFGLPLILFQVPSGVDMGDLEFIEGKVLAGDYFQVSDNIDALNDLIEFEPATGKTAFLIEAKISPKTNISIPTNAFGSSVTISDQVIADLIIDAVVKDKTGIGGSGNAWGGNGTGASGSGARSHTPNGQFNVLGLSLVGNSSKKIQIKNVLDAGSAFATMSGYLIDT